MKPDFVIDSFVCFGSSFVTGIVFNQPMNLCITVALILGVTMLVVLTLLDVIDRLKR